MKQRCGIEPQLLRAISKIFTWTLGIQVRIPKTENSYLITGLTPGVTYIVEVYAVVKEVQSEADTIEATTGLQNDWSVCSACCLPVYQ